MRGSTILFESEDLGESPQHVEVHKPAAAVTNSQVKRKPVQYYDAPAAQSEVSSNVGGPRAGPPTLPRSVNALGVHPARQGTTQGRSGGGRPGSGGE
ncbi:hypothetical protein FRC09_015481 [Ceratobasidium sp. 395]|nr:hypothetical protein FRC09_015481 [Ceratobasidium sp. 395]